jgi:GTP-binding protein EngB required for normal cell division
MNSSPFLKLFLLLLNLWFVFSHDYDLVDKNDTREFNILLLGQSRSGKSCFVNSILNKKLAKVGSDDGEPTTEKMSFYSGILKDKIIVNLIDTKGLDSSSRDLLNLYEITNSLENKTKIDLILYFYSLTSESKTLKSDLEKIKFIFGNLSNLEIILTKAEKINKTYNKYIQDTLKEYSNEISFPTIFINSKCNNKLDSIVLNKIIEKLQNISINYEINSQDLEYFKGLHAKIGEYKNSLNSTISDILNLMYKNSKNEKDKIEEMTNKTIIGNIIFWLIALPISLYLTRKYFPKNIVEKIMSIIKKPNDELNDTKNNQQMPYVDNAQDENKQNQISNGNNSDQKLGKNKTDELTQNCVENLENKTEEEN